MGAREKLKAAREKKHKTQRDVADAIGVSLITYRQIEQGRRIGRVETWDKLEDYFKVDQRKLRETF